MGFWADTYWADTCWTDTYWSKDYLLIFTTPACRTATIEFENRTLEVTCH